MLDLSKIKFLPSPNASNRTKKPDYIVLHCTSGSFLGACSWLRNPKSKVSAHYVVSKLGEVVCLVPPEKKAWHVKNFNNRAIGIEMEDYKKEGKLNCITDPHWLTEAELKTVVSLTASLMKKFNIPLTNVIDHSNPMLKAYGNNHKDVGPHWPWDRFKALVKEELDDDSTGGVSQD